MDRCLPHVDLSRPVAWVSQSAQDTDPRHFLEDIEGLLGVAIDRMPAEAAGWEDAGLVLVTHLPEAASLLPVGVRFQSCLGRQGVVMGLGAPAAGFGEAVFPGSVGQPGPGLQWLPDAVILPGTATTPDAADLHEWLRGGARRFALRLPPESMLAFGPQGEVEVWGGPQPGLTLGPGWTHI